MFYISYKSYTQVEPIMTTAVRVSD